jgi:very-short-patch-repair endonuclease
MPISLVAEHFDPATSRFDVVIIDEASQADLNALIPLYMGKQVIVVGDHEQVTPLGVGKDITLLENLRRSMLQDIPNSHLFDNQSSIYDIGRQSFGDAIRLVEHFRCVPEIIAFSNQLSYGGTIRALRESNSTHIKPACVSHRVEGVREGDTNKREAEQIVALIKAMTKHEAYAGKTIGVISMVKESQAALIQSLLHKEIDSVEIEKRRIQAGISSEFQGDERDIMFLSMVDSQSDEGPLRTTGEGAFELTKKRYNVAVSRARDQLWVVHSFDPDLHLKSADLRFRLLQHVKDPLASIRAFDEEAKRTESPFEREVLKLLLGAGYCVKTQWQVGYFRIDMVVEGGAKRLAVECDGDRYHPIEKLAEDVERQAILERLGWKFIRIRGSAFYRDPNLAMQAVFSKLEELGIPPEGNGGEAPLSDMTLIHELFALVNGDAECDETLTDIGTVPSYETADLQFEDGDFDLELNGHPDLGAFTEIPDGIKDGRAIGIPRDLKRGQVELLLESFDGSASLGDFLRRLAKIRGYQRVGRIVRKSLQSEISALRRKGKVTIEDGMIRLL